MEGISVNTVEQKYEINQEGGKVIQKYDFSEYGDDKTDEIKKYIESQLKKYLRSLEEIYGEIEYNVQWIEDDLSCIEADIESDIDAVIDIVSSTTLSSFIHRSPIQAYDMIVENKKWIEKHKRDVFQND